MVAKQFKKQADSSDSITNEAEDEEEIESSMKVKSLNISHMFK